MRITVDDTTIEVAAEGRGEAVVMLHGFPLAREIWDAQAAQLASRTFVIRPDLRGMGRSGVPDGPYLMETLAGDVAAVLDAARIDRVSLVGHSLGGYVAMAFCRMYGERVSKLALVCSRLGADSSRAAKEREDLADRIEREDRIDAVVDAYVPRLFAPYMLEKRDKTVDFVRELARLTNVRGAAAMLRGMAQRVDSTDIAQELQMPVLIVAGAADQVVPAPESEEMRRAFPRAALRVLGRSGHLPMLEEPGAFGEILAEFLG